MIAGGRQRQAQEVAQLENGDHYGDPGRETGHHRVGHELDESAQPGQAQANQNDAGERRGDAVTQKDQRKLATSERALQALDEWMGTVVVGQSR